MDIVEKINVIVNKQERQVIPATTTILLEKIKRKNEVDIIDIGNDYGQAQRLARFNKELKDKTLEPLVVIKVYDVDVADSLERIFSGTVDQLIHKLTII